MCKLLFSSIALIFSSACSVFGVETVEEARYELERKDKQFEIRQYAPSVMAETREAADFKEAGSKSFRKLFAYISGENESSEKIAMTSPVLSAQSNNSAGQSIAMTAPVFSDKDGEDWRYRFVLPATLTIDTAPRPLNPEVQLIEIPQKRVATLRYSGRATAKAQSARAKELGSWMETQGLVAESEPRWAGYNAPWTLPWFRRNEVLIDVPTQ